VLLHGRNIEPTGNLLGDADGEAVTSSLKQAPALSSLRALHSASAPFSTASALPRASANAPFERLWKRDVVDGFVAWAMGTSVAWVRAASVLQAPWRPDYFVLTLIHGKVNTG
jgi:hypothetical protein